MTKHPVDLTKIAPGVDLDAADLPVGTVLRRKYKGKVHVVHVLEPLAEPHWQKREPGEDDRYDETAAEVAKQRRWWRYQYGGQRYRSLSAIAHVITGNRYESGNRFFGLRLRRRGSSCRQTRSRRATE